MLYRQRRGPNRQRLKRKTFMVLGTGATFALAENGTVTGSRKARTAGVL
jgi:hypothetical protein